VAKIPIFIIDDQILFCETLAKFISDIDHFELIGAYTDSKPLLADSSLLDTERSIIGLVDMNLPGLNGIELNNLFQINYPNIKIIILSVFNSPMLIKQMINAKAAAYLEKSTNTEELIRAIEQVNETGYYYNNSVLKAMQSNIDNIQTNNSVLPSKLSKRETEILHLICNELNSAEIANKLFLSKRTVENYRNNLLVKTGSHNTAGLVLYAIRHNLIFSMLS
jgi:DNA-binding NarL/FixJ family response regulator